MSELETKRQKKKKHPVAWFCISLSLVLALLLAGPIIERIQKYNYPTTYNAEVQRWAGEYEIDPYLVFAIIRTESGFSPDAQSDAGARGLMQMTEDTFDWIKTKIAAEEALTFEDLFKPEVSIRFGSYYYSISLERYGNDIATAAAAYHSGWGTVDELLANGEYTQNGVHLSSFPFRQMNHYVNKVTQSYEKYLSIYT